MGSGLMRQGGWGEGGQSLSCQVEAELSSAAAFYMQVCLSLCDVACVEGWVLVFGLGGVCF